MLQKLLISLNNEKIWTVDFINAFFLLTMNLLPRKDYLLYAEEVLILVTGWIAVKDWDN